MLVPVTNLWNHSFEAVKKAVKAVIRQRYFPEIWYLSESWFQTLRGRRILIIGYGLGLLPEAFAKQGWAVTTTDTSVAALADIRQRFNLGGMDGTFQQGDPTKLPFEALSFDAVLCVNVLEFCEHPRAVILEMDRLLVEGGHGLIATFNRFSPWGISSVARLARFDDQRLRGHFLDRELFGKLFLKSSLVVENLVTRANYLPVGTPRWKMKLPVAGAFVALVKKKH